MRYPYQPPLWAVSVILVGVAAHGVLLGLTLGRWWYEPQPAARGDRGMSVVEMTRMEQRTFAHGAVRTAFSLAELKELVTPPDAEHRFHTVEIQPGEVDLYIVPRSAPEVDGRTIPEGSRLVGMVR